jgi:hypothetical protein
VRRRGEPVFPLTQPNGRKSTHSGCTIEVSGRDFADFAGQIRDAIRFLKRHGPALRTLRRFPGVESARLDFGVAWRDVVAQYDVFPEELVVLAGRCQLGLETSHYPVASGRSDGKRTAGNRKSGHGAPLNNSKRMTEEQQAYAEFCAYRAQSKRTSRSSSTMRTASGKTKRRRSR